MSELLNFPPLDLVPPDDQGRPPDHEARRRALDVRLSAIVEAPAGSGKTGLLLQRYLKLLAEGDISQPEEILAITFTRKATAELRERVLEQLQAAADGQPLPEDASSFELQTRSLAAAALAADARHGWRLLDQPQRLRIRTIDALCAEIARTLPLLSGSGTNQPIESAESLHREAARRTLLELGGPDAALNSALETVLLHRDGNLNDCEALIARMLEQRQQWGELVPLDSASISEEHLDTEVRPRLERSLETIVCAGLNRAIRAVETIDRAILPDLASLLGKLGAEPSLHPTKPSAIAIWAGRFEAPEACAGDLAHWRALLHLLFTQAGDWRKSFASGYMGFDTSYEDRGILTEIVNHLQANGVAEVLLAIRELPPGRLPEEQWRVAKALFRLLRHALAHLKVVFAETGHCDFSELALAACEALSAEDGAADLSHSPGARLTHLLVDEMQDTSSSQYMLLERLTRSWDGHSQTVFLVGDPKQSIYLFRQARVERFLRTVAERRLGDVPLEALRLTANFRSQGALVEAFNGMFSELFPQTAVATQALGEELEVPFVRADAIRSASAHPLAIEWHPEILGNQPLSSNCDTKTAEPRAARMQREARHIRRIIEEWRAKPLPEGRTKPWSIAVLARARKHLTSITAELSRDGGTGPIPFRAVQIDALDECPEVLDALALTRALLHPADRAAWLAVLRAPWCGLALADLLHLTGEGPEADRDVTLPELIGLRGGQLSANGQQLLARAWTTLDRAVRTLGRTSFAAHVERTWLSLGGDACLSPARRANVRRFFEVLRELEQESDGAIDTAVLNARLAKLFAESTPDENAVQLLTIHNSKGLEFDVVLIPGLERSTNRSRSELLNWLEVDPADGAAAHILLAPIGSRGDQAQGLNQWISRVKRSRENAELRRLLYVACTRAREALHLFAACDAQKDGTARIPGEGTLLRAAWPVAAMHFHAHGNSAEAPAAIPTISTRQSNLLPFTSGSVSEEGLALAASAGEATRAVPVIHRLPLAFNPLARFTSTDMLRLPYTPASELPQSPAFERPEGSFTVRAFGNTVHRFLQLVSSMLATGDTPDTLLGRIPSWEPRLVAALRNEGLSSASAQRESQRAMRALLKALEDPVGRWILSPHKSAVNEHSIASVGSSLLRADRTFVAGSAPLTAGDDRIWIIDFKTTEQGSRSPERFEQDELLKYRDQLERYAAVQSDLSPVSRSIGLGLYYPLIPRLLHWTF
ncbi:MAG TPA: UvrD-helicase domain-containing protein [Acidobacteriaceae bacterium]|nr:UvrD-helicase domain-containing protein [Acidobacteriaceae bacterium]